MFAHWNSFHPQVDMDKTWNLKAMVDDICEDLGALRSYLAPEKKYHTGKRGGPNCNKPHKLLEDLHELINAEK
jgi:hypothetical protein